MAIFKITLTNQQLKFGEGTADEFAEEPKKITVAMIYLGTLQIHAVSFFWKQSIQISLQKVLTCNRQS